jgi:hypothetical protein
MYSKYLTKGKLTYTYNNITQSKIPLRVTCRTLHGVPPVIESAQTDILCIPLLQAVLVKHVCARLHSGQIGHQGHLAYPAVERGVSHSLVTGHW